MGGLYQSQHLVMPLEPVVRPGLAPVPVNFAALTLCVLPLAHPCHRDPKGVRIRFEKVRAFEFFLLSPVDCAKMVDAVTQAHEGVIHAEQEAEALKRSVRVRCLSTLCGWQASRGHVGVAEFCGAQVTERELGALEAIAGSAILERFGIEAELSDVLHMLNTATPDTLGAPDPDPRQIAFGEWALLTSRVGSTTHAVL